MASFSISRTLVAASSLFAAVRAVDNTTEPISTFYSRPDLQAPALNCTISDGAIPGYMFLAPYGATQSGPYIYDKSCNLIWSGWAQAGPASSHDLTVCAYNGSDHLCVFQGNQALGYARGHGMIYDNTYTAVKSIQIGEDGFDVDQHEFNMLDDGYSALVTAYKQIPYDLSDYNITTGVGYLMTGVFQEIEVETGNVLFNWNSLDHVPLNESVVLPNGSDTSGTGLTASTAWDYFHINAIDKSSYSNTYLVSARHTSTIYNLNTTDGSINWRLSYLGASDFTIQNFNFSFQHDVRFVSENETTTIISFFDNASNGYNNTNSESSGLVVALDMTSMTATLLVRTNVPDGGVLSTSQGNLQLLPNGGYFNGWGSEDDITEYAADGTPVLHATFGAYPVMNYRAFTYNWTAAPTTSPALYAYAQNASAPTALYVSWNGATEVAGWRFFGGDETGNVTTSLGEAKWAGFETGFMADGYYPYVYAEAVAENGTSLGKSSVGNTFVPNALYASSCDAVACPTATAYGS
ncbi:hypothetical protein K490DRAFT_68486 [Saccharata proteae CBS 121410]|uniref:ASST-domain-containing protein n=1 Tax=Saccharata proteae CBS 121410 TaxID=1314787 RepID=A0A9P4HN56_9PEZI|nr:hypothetical protein K490DRAFT_68486 [Saccharata proteae CBS 121410]